MYSHRRGEALPLRLGGLRLEVCPFRRTDAPLQEAHGPPAVPVSEVRQGLFQVRPPRSPHEEAPMRLHTELFGLLFFFFFAFLIEQNQIFSSGCCRTTRHAVAFTARVQFSLEGPSVCVCVWVCFFILNTTDLTTPLSQGCKASMKGTKLESILFN